MIRRALSLLASCFVVAACTSSTSSSGADAGRVSADQACADLAHARCHALETCAPPRIQIAYGDEAICETRVKEECVAAQAAPSTGATPAATEACAGAFASWACSDLLDDTHTPAACAQVTGALASGAACAFSGQCPSGFCAIAPAAACGTCAAVPKAGDSCADLAGCGPGMTCTVDTQTCQPYLAQGGACSKGLPCGAGLSCVGADSATGKTGTCQAAVAMQGAACDPTQKTGPGCDRDRGLVCNVTSKQCEPMVVAGGGQPCGLVGGQITVCGSSGVCTGATATTPGTCTAAAADGATCSTPGLRGCETPARCVGTGATGTCEMPGPSACH